MHARGRVAATTISRYANLDSSDPFFQGNAKNCPPHCFAIAAGAYNQLMQERRNQAICISGESGAGKTESMKLMLQFLAEASGRSSSGSADADDNMEQKIIETNPVTGLMSPAPR